MKFSNLPQPLFAKEGSKSQVSPFKKGGLRGIYPPEIPH